MCNLGVMHMAFNGSYKQKQLMSKSLADTKDSVVLWLIFIYLFCLQNIYSTFWQTCFFISSAFFVQKQQTKSKMSFFDLSS